MDSSQKYSQILGDLHHTNNFTTQLSNKSTSSTTSSQHHIYKTRSYNKENYYNNQRGALRGGPKSGWHRSNSSISSNNYRATAFSSKDNKRTDENGNSGSNSNVGDDGKEPLKFNEGELEMFSLFAQMYSLFSIVHCEKFLHQLTSICITHKKRTILCNNSHTYHSDHQSLSSHVCQYSHILVFAYSESFNWQLSPSAKIYFILRWIHTHNYATSGRTLQEGLFWTHEFKDCKFHIIITDGDDDCMPCC